MRAADRPNLNAHINETHIFFPFNYANEFRAFFPTVHFFVHTFLMRCRSVGLTRLQIIMVIKITCRARKRSQLVRMCLGGLCPSVQRARDDDTVDDGDRTATQRSRNRRSNYPR